MSSLQDAPIVARPQAQAMVDVAGQREVAEVMGAIMAARRFPRDHTAALDRIVMACCRPELASIALYTYARGGTEITGPSIRMAEAIAQNWGNFQFGIRELEQRHGESTVEAFAIDLETNTRQVKVFQVPHVRYTKSKGSTALEDPRDVYEQVANQGARRLRACILGIIPGDVIDAAVQQVETTLKAKHEATPERIKTMLEKFSEFGVTQAMIEKRIQRRIDSMTPALMVNLSKVYNSLKDGMGAVTDFFEVEAAANGATRTAQVTDALKRKDAPSEAKQVAGAAPAAASSGEPAPADDPDGPNGERVAAKSDDDLPFPNTPTLADRISAAAQALSIVNDRGKIGLPAEVANEFGINPSLYLTAEELSKRPLAVKLAERLEALAQAS